MGMPVSLHVRGAGARDASAAYAAHRVFADLRAADAVFSTYREDSEISRLARGELTLAGCSLAVREVAALSEIARVRTDGYVDAWAAPGRAGTFDPTVLVKTWAVARSVRFFDDLPGLSLAIGAGGDILVRPGADLEPWQIGIEDPRERSTILATVPVHDGGVATSGVAARGAHIVDPHTGLAATQVLSATVVGPSLLWADVWATALVARGADAVDWTATLHGTSGLLVLADGRVHRWQNAP
ncbi:FAD:protein FMN transferase [Pengzhenrongella sicca]|uniref:FAD:protein FMN transferase n=2 Tax=Pengzhenrongella sicca TaxID=2819238 RepID=A0A8A4ZMA6_9MICO|nr:FAD:protein FMN transferase [Pengzhenrongella sicca]